MDRKMKPGEIILQEESEGNRRVFGEDKSVPAKATLNIIVMKRFQTAARSWGELCRGKVCFQQNQPALPCNRLKCLLPHN